MAGAFKCPKCKRTTSLREEFCPNCGEALTIKCPKCGHSWRWYYGHKYCPKCGAKIGK